MFTEREKQFLERAIELSRKGMMDGHGGPFGCVIVRGDEIVGEGCNQVTSSNDPTAHAEIVAIRDACRRLNTYQLTGCDVYASCEPCPMCMGAIYWARPSRVIYANTKQDAAAIAFDDDFIYKEINTLMTDRKIPFLHFPHPLAKEVFEQWRILDDKKLY
ncbi:MAG: nucleoside deaminase [Chitinophagaceae bacterium]